MENYFHLIVEDVQSNVSHYLNPPSIKDINLVGRSRSLYRGLIYWFYFRYYLPPIFLILFFILFILSLTKYNTIEGNLVLGSSLSLFMTLTVLTSYIMIIPWRKHPSSLILYKSLTSIFFSLIIIFEALSTNKYSCRSYAVFTQYFFLAGEGWLTTISLDLVYSLTNPFISYKTNLKKYHALVWTFSSLISFVFYLDTSCQGQFDQGICWINIQSTNSPCLWGYFLFWILLMYSYQFYAIFYARNRLNKGLPSTFEVRKKCAEETFQCLSIYATYLVLLVLMFIIMSFDPSPRPNSGMAKFSLFFLFVISNRGSVDGMVWFMLHKFDLATLTSSGKGVYKPLTPSTDDTAETIIDSLPKLGLRLRKSKIDVENIKHKVTSTITELADMAIAELDETDMSPQVNTALRQQIVYYVTKGVRNAILKIDVNVNPDEEIKDIMDNILRFHGRDPAAVPGLSVLSFLLDREYPFKAFAPDIFQQIRHNEGINDDRYLKILSASANERLSEGASGAFMFFCGGGEFIVKTIRSREAKVLHTSLKTYSYFLQKYPESLLCRILGSYSLELYSQTFYFVVMLNCFDPHAYINDRFDIKGSWVGRSAEPKKKGKKVVCRHCNEYFIPSKGETCKAIVGKHEANVVLKDNDLRTKISLPIEDAKRVVKILKRDSELLGRLGVMDYSLIIGVKKWRYDVAITEEMIQFKPDSFIKSSLDGDSVVADHKGPSSTFLAKTVTGPAVYHFGVIDFLQNWTVEKRIERAFKIYALRKDPDGLSVMAPLEYKIRFQQKLDQIFDLEPSGGIGKADSALTSSPKPTVDPAFEVDDISALDGETESEAFVKNPLQEDFF